MGAASLVFSDRRYAALGGGVFAGMAVPLLALSGFVFFEPRLAWALYPGEEGRLALVIALAGLSGLVVPMSAYRALSMGGGRGRGGRATAAGSALGAAAGACGCGPVGLALFSAFGGAGASFAALLTNYEVPIRLAAIAVLCAAYWAAARSIGSGCGIRRLDGGSGVGDGPGAGGQAQRSLRG